MTLIEDKKETIVKMWACTQKIRKSCLCFTSSKGLDEGMLLFFFFFWLSVYSFCTAKLLF